MKAFWYVSLIFIYFFTFQFIYSQGISLQVQTSRPVIVSGDSVKVTIKAFNPNGTTIHNIVVDLPWGPGYSDIEFSGQVSGFSTSVWTIPAIAPLQSAVLTITYPSVVASTGNVFYSASITSIDGISPSQSFSVKAVLRVNSCHTETTPSVIFDISDTTTTIPLPLSLSSVTPNILSGNWQQQGVGTLHSFTNLSIGSSMVADLASAPFSLVGFGMGIYDIQFTSLQDANVCDPVYICHERKVELTNLSPIFQDTGAIASSKTGFLCHGDTIPSDEFFTTVGVPSGSAIRNFAWWVEDIPAGVDATGGLIPTSEAMAQPQNTLSNYSWTNSSNTPKPITFKVKVTYANGGSSVTRIQTIMRYIAPAITVTITNSPSFVPGIGGMIHASTEGGWGGYNYLWNSAETTASISIAGTGTFVVAVTDRKGCKGFDSVAYTTTPLVATVSSIQPVRCHGGNDGSISLSVSGAVAPYTFLWSNGDTTQTISDLTAGSYMVTITAANGESQILSIDIPQPTGALEANISGVNATCHNSDNAMAWVSISGGTPPYNLSWNNGQSSDTIAGLSPGNYSVAVTDSNSCSATASINLTAPVAQTLTFTGSDSICFGETVSLPITTSTSDILQNAMYSIKYSPHLSGGSFFADSSVHSITSASPLSFTPDTVGVYVLSFLNATDTSNCPMDIIGGTYTLYVRPNIMVAASSTHTLESGVPFSYRILTSGGSSNNYSFHIDKGSLPPGLELTTDGKIEGSTSYSNGGTFDTVSVSITESTSCPATHLFIYRINNTSSALQASKYNICEGDTTTLLLTTNRTGCLSYQWSSSAGLDTAITDVPVLHIAPTSSRTYFVNILRNDMVIETLSIDITVYPRPGVSLVSDIPSVGNFATLGDSIIITALPSTYPYYQFTYNGTPHSNTISNRYATNAWIPKRNNEVSVVVRSVDGCENIATTVFMGPEFELPNIFNPDLERLLPGFELDVFNRWGELLYSGNEGWNAVYKGTKVPSGTYYYVVYLRSSDGSKISLKYHVFVKY